MGLKEQIDYVRNVKFQMEMMQQTMKETIYQRYEVPYKIDDEDEGTFIDYDKVERTDPRVPKIIAMGKEVNKIFIKAMKNNQKFTIDLMKKQVVIHVADIEVYRK